VGYVLLAFSLWSLHICFGSRLYKLNYVSALNSKCCKQDVFLPEGSQPTGRKEVNNMTKEDFKSRAYVQYQSAIEDMRRVAAESEKKDIQDIEEYREPLSCEQRIEVKLLLSWGGPSDGFKLYFSPDGVVEDGYYFFADWFEYEQYRLSQEELDLVLSVYPIYPSF
jgi:hypothetical protein